MSRFLQARQRIAALLGKELLSSLRDRRSMLTALLLPFLTLPLMCIVFAIAAMAGMGGIRLDPLKVGYIGEMPSALAKQLTVPLLGPLSLNKLDANQVDEQALSKWSYVLRMPAQIPEGLDATPAEILIEQRARDKRALAGLALIEAGIKRYNEQLLKDHLAALGVSDSARSPLRTRVVVKSAGFNVLGLLLPLLLLVWCGVGAQASALESTSGERERNTLEGLLLAPSPRHEIVLAKFLSIALMALLAAASGLAGAALSVTVVSMLMQGGLAAMASAAVSKILGGGLLSSIDPTGFAILTVMLLALATTMASVILFACVFARSTNEAQFYIAPAMLLCIGLSLPAQFKEFFFSDALYWLPITGVVACFVDVLNGALSAWHLLTALAMSVLFALAVLALTAICFRRESVVFRA